MGTWGSGSFDNDDALDWVFELTQAEGTGAVTGALENVTDNDDYLEAPEAQQALAAAEVVAALHGHPAGDLPEEVRSWVRRCGKAPGPKLLRLALAAVARVRSDSELQALWEEADPAAWHEKVDDLQQRLKR